MTTVTSPPLEADPTVSIAPQRPRVPPAARTRPRSTRRLDIQGLRALAVLLVVANHLTDKPAGGFAGVDIFFVVSGYVITRLMLIEREKTGRISLTHFYVRRLRRIAPLAVLVLGVTVAIGALLLTSTKAQQLATDSAWAMLLSANWRFVALGTDYLHATDTPSALQHYWSLAVEEQFYLVWPLLLIALSLAFRKRFRPAATCAAGVLGAASFVFALWQSTAVPTAAYFSTWSRGWELLLGCALALCAGATARIPARYRSGIAWLGLAAITAGVLHFVIAQAFPAPGALLVVIGTACVIGAGEGGATEVYPLTNPVSAHIGDLSYAIYLWHFPVLTFVAILHPQLGGQFMAWTLLVTACLAVTTHHVIENPLRRLGHRRDAMPGRRTRLRRSLAPIAVLVTLASIVGATATHAAYQPTTSDLSQLQLHRSTSALSSERTALVDEALRQKAWPKMPFDDSDLANQRAPQWIKQGCLGGDVNSESDPMKNSLRCVFGNPSASRTVVLIGDSTAISYLPGLIAAARGTWRIETFTVQQCPAIQIQVKFGDGAAHLPCDTFHKNVLAHLRATRPDLVVLTSSPDSSYRLLSGAVDTAAQEEWRDASATTLSSMSRYAARVAMLDSPPSTQSVQECHTPFSAPADCSGGLDPVYLRQIEAQHQATQGLQHVIYPDTLNWFCNSEGVCPVLLGDLPQTVDGRHLLEQQAVRLGPLMREQLGL